tara:strand:- start:345 stop:539 length:195 start_codon:yes stop_codon:yes gene_type:complete
VKLGSGMAIARRLAEITSANNNILEHIEILLEESKRLAKNVEELADIVEQAMKYETWEIDSKDE